MDRDCIRVLIKDFIDLYNDFTNEFLDIFDIIMEGFDEDIMFLSDDSVNYFQRSDDDDSTIDETEEEVEEVPTNGCVTPLQSPVNEVEDDSATVIVDDTQYTEPSCWWRSTDNELQDIIRELEGGFEEGFEDEIANEDQKLTEDEFEVVDMVESNA